ncbi:ankyrin repeat domain-containing protein [Nonomuraea rosea]|uniref:Ankyrin repeat domain-containing protein n=1 Tax=Nonomuraea rosea TaxID=638574 RepID=A0ABP6VNV5_9ACTN
MDSLSLGTLLQNLRRVRTIPCTAPYRGTIGSIDGDPELEGAATTSFGLAGAGGHRRARRACAEADVPAGLADGKGDTLLMPAAYYGHAETVRLLVTSGAGPRTVNGRGRPSTAPASGKKESAMVRALPDAAAGPMARAPSAVDTARKCANDQLIQCFSQ